MLPSTVLQPTLSTNKSDEQPIPTPSGYTTDTRVRTLATLPIEVQLEIVRQVASEGRWVSILLFDMEVSYFQTSVARQLLQTSRHMAIIAETVIAD
jgi:hypothetical protein